MQKPTFKKCQKCDKSVCGPKNEVYTWGKYSCSTEVMFSAHEDSVWPMLPPRTFSVGFEEDIVPGVMFFTFTDPKIVVKSLFPILYLKKKQQQTPYFHDSTP